MIIFAMSSSQTAVWVQKCCSCTGFSHLSVLGDILSLAEPCKGSRACRCCKGRYMTFLILTLLLLDSFVRQLNLLKQTTSKENLFLLVLCKPPSEDFPVARSWWEKIRIHTWYLKSEGESQVLLYPLEIASSTQTLSLRAGDINPCICALLCSFKSRKNAEDGERRHCKQRVAFPFRHYYVSRLAISDISQCQKASCVIWVYYTFSLRAERFFFFFSTHRLVQM